MHKIALLIGLAIGYVLGARAGRERYEQLSRAFEDFKSSPKTQEVLHVVQDKTHEVADHAKETAAEKVQEVKDSRAESTGRKKTSDRAEGNQSTASGAPSSGAAPDGLDPTAGPKGDLP